MADIAVGDEIPIEADTGGTAKVWAENLDPDTNQPLGTFVLQCTTADNTLYWVPDHDPTLPVPGPDDVAV